MKTDKPKNNLEIFFSDSRADEFFGRAFCFKAEVLAGLLGGECNLAAIARKHGLTRAAASAQAVRARRIYGLSSKPI